MADSAGMIAAAIFIVAVLGANLTATLFIPFPVFGQVAVGTLVFGITFTQRDRMHHRGRGFVYTVIAVAAAVNFIMMVSLQLWWGAPFQEWMAARGWLWMAEALGYLEMSGWRVLLASFLAILFAETVNTEVYQKFRDRSWMGRVSRSNGVAIPVDSVIFNLIAFAGVFAMVEWVSIVFGEIVTKFAVGMAYALLRPRREVLVPPPAPVESKALLRG
ncbi:MAG: VUT family protein [Opitutales bacterium]|nr:VUT family protein [Opitutales bacterium]